MPAAVGDLDAMLRDLEDLVRPHFPRCEYYFGEKSEAMRQKSPPYICWIVRQADALDEVRETAGTVRRSWRDDGVLIIAVCAGEVPVNLQSRDLRRQQLDASLRLMLALTWHVERVHQGYYEDRGWRPVNPEMLSDSHYPVEYSFVVRAARRTPTTEETQATSVESSLVLR